MPEIEVKISHERLRGAAKPLLDFVNEMQAFGFRPDECLTAMMFCTGIMLKQIGADLNTALPVGLALPPLALGYQSAQPAGQANQIVTPGKFAM